MEVTLSVTDSSNLLCFNGGRHPLPWKVSCESMAQHLIWCTGDPRFPCNLVPAEPGNQRLESWEGRFPWGRNALQNLFLKPAPVAFFSVKFTLVIYLWHCRATFARNLVPSSFSVGNLNWPFSVCFITGWIWDHPLLTLHCTVARYSVRAKHVFSELSEKPFVVELDMRGTCLIQIFK